MQVLRFAEKVFTFVLMTRYLWIGAVALSLLALREANSSQPPVARTGAPFDNGSCGSCHRGGSPAPTITFQVKQRMSVAKSVVNLGERA